MAFRAQEPTFRGSLAAKMLARGSTCGARSTAAPSLRGSAVVVGHGSVVDAATTATTTTTSRSRSRSHVSRGRVFFATRVPGARCAAWRGEGLNTSFAARPAGVSGRRDRPVVLRRTAASEARQRQRTLPKYFDWKEAEGRLYGWWESEGCFRPIDGRSGAEEGKFVMAMPPPNVTGALHMGHAMFVTIEDIMARHARMCGKDVLWIPGTDHAGIATQMVVEKSLAAEGVAKADLGREAFVDKVWEWKETYGHRITDQLRALGASCDWSRESFTLDDNLSAAVVEAFNRLHDEGLIYRGSYMVNWSPNLQTAVSDLEVEYSDETGTLYYFKYPIAAADGSGAAGGDEEGISYLPVATSRPETILGDTAVAVNPSDPRFSHLIGSKAIVPFVGREVPIIGDEGVDVEFGTGALKVTPAHDMNDYALGKKHGLEFVRIMNKDGTLNGECAEYAGLDRFKARERVWSDLEACGMAVRTEAYETRVPKSQRGGEVIEPMLSEQWFVEMKPLADPSLDLVRRGDVKIVPQRFEKVYNNWLENIQDWCISRQLWWGHRIPAWYCYEGREEAERGARGAHAGSPYVVASSEEEAYAKARAEHGEGVFLVQEEDVLDTWFSSSLWPFSTLGWPNEGAEDLKRFYPTSMLETGHDILFFWVARMIMMGQHLTGEAPFHTVYLHGLIRDEKGRKMSKTLGNVIDPLTVIEEYGTDALRFTLATGTTPGQDLNLSLEKIEASRNLVNKIWNASKFVLSCLEKLEEEGYEWNEESLSTGAGRETLPFAERWVLAELSALVEENDRAHARHDIGEAGRATYNFFWGQFADWYLEVAKTRLYSDDREEARRCMGVLLKVFLSSLRLLHPYMPFVTEEVYQVLAGSGDSIVNSRWPRPDEEADGGARASFAVFQDAVRSIRNIRAEQQVPVNKKISALLVIDDEGLRAEVASEARALEFLCKIEGLRIIERGEAEALSSEEHIETVVNDGFCVYIPLAGLVDAEQEISRLRRQATKIEKDLATLEGRLSSPSFVEKAPKKVVDETVAKRDDLAQQLSMVRGRLDVLVAA